MRRGKLGCTLSRFALALFAAGLPVVWAGPLLDSLQDPAVQSELSRVSLAVPTLNRVTLLHLGRTALPARVAEINAAENYIFQIIPYWYDDDEGRAMLDRFRTRRTEHPGLDVRFITDWVSPAGTGDLFVSKQYKQLKLVSGGQLAYWNPPTWLKLWSGKLSRYHLHEKLIVVDGKKLIMGGLNVANEYLQGGETREGWHDTDVLLEGPVAQEGASLFVKIWQLIRHIKKHKFFPDFSRDVVRVLDALFYSDAASNLDSPRADDLSYRFFFWKVKVKLGIQDYLANPFYFPRGLAEPADGVPVRLMYTNPLVNRDPKTLAYRSPLRDTMELLGRYAKQELRLFVPYMTFSPEFKRWLTDLARAGMRVEVITNSLKSHDIGKIPYYAALSHYRELLEAGVRIFEWQGHEDLLELEKANHCEIPRGWWPGRTIHTKAAVFDGEVWLVGAHNFNVRSEYFNSETMALIEDPLSAGQMRQVFEDDLDLAPADGYQVKCGDQMLTRPRRVEEIDLAKFAAMEKKHRAKIRTYKKFQNYF
ncbi:MAG: phosphatidylserine/phosphatidylglycerophosphate/cardiolipin synthase family protein [Bacteriovoracia bacterium]